MISPRDEQYLREAIRLSQQKMLEGEGGPFGALVVRDEKILGQGWNRVTTANDPTAHAEISAIRSACSGLGSFHLAGATIYTSCEPCPMCLGAILWARIARIVYGATRLDAAAAGFDDQAFYDELNLAPEHRSVPTEQALHEEALIAFTAWKLNPQRREY